MKNNISEERNNLTRTLIVFAAGIIVFLGIYSLYDSISRKNSNSSNKSNNVSSNEDDKITNNKFKEEYEVLNNKKIESAKENNYLKISIDADNPIKYSYIDEIIDTIKNGTGIIYLGYPECPWCRNAVPVLLDAAKDAEIEEILYLNAHDIRDQYQVVNGELVKTSDGDKKYPELLAALDSILDEYIVTDEEGTEYETGEKRLYVPTVIFVKDGTIVGSHVGTLDFKNGQTKYDRLDKEQQEELKEIYLNYIEAIYQEYCDEAC